MILDDAAESRATNPQNATSASCTIGINSFACQAIEYYTVEVMHTYLTEVVLKWLV